MEVKVVLPRRDPGYPLLADDIGLARLGVAMGTGQLYIRRNVWSLDPTQAFASEVTVNYAKAVRVMQQRDRTDPTSWSYQAAIHGTPDPAPSGAPWNQCQHSTWYFLPWHRMYLWFFEQIVREAIAEAGGDPTGWPCPTGTTATDPSLPSTPCRWRSGSRPCPTAAATRCTCPIRCATTATTPRSR